MIIVNLMLDNIYNFFNFDVNFTYPRKIVNSTIADEHVFGHPNFRYKKAIVLMGSNATGKTCLGRAIKNMVSFINEGNAASIISMVNDKNKKAFASIEFINDGENLCKVEIQCEGSEVKVSVFKSLIGLKDSYETTKEKLEEVYNGFYSNRILEFFGKLDCKFAYPEIERTLKTNSVNDKKFLTTLKCVIGTLDPSLKNVMVSKDLKNSFIIKRGDDEIIIQDGKLLNRELLSSGTVEGVDVALFLAAMGGDNEAFYYCDEHFSFIQTEIEKRIFQLMLGKLKDNEQLIFTTHNADMLDLNIPIHAFALLRRKEDHATELVFASSLLKRNTDSVRCAVENDAFASIPDLSLLDELEV